MLLKLFISRKFFFTTFLFLFAFANLQAQNDRIVYLEYAPGNDPLQSIVINWITGSDDTDPQLEYREEGGSSWIEVSGSDHRIPISGQNSGKRRNSVLITDLSPGTSYEVRVDGETERFRTPPSDADNFRFIVGGDLYDGKANDLVRFKELSEKAVAQDPYFAVVGGDLANANADPDVATERWQILMRNWYEQMRTAENYLIPFVAVIGNNDIPNDFGDEPEDATFFHAYFSYPGFQGYGVLDFGDFLRIITLDTNHTVPIEGKQTEWLEDRMSEAFGSFEHLIPIYHVAAYPSVENVNNENSVKIRGNWKPIFEQYGVRYAFEHDNHAYKKINSINGVSYLGDGGWGIESRNPERFSSIINLDEYAKVNHVQVVELNNSNIDVEPIFYLEPPDIENPTDVTETGFRANWEPMEGVDQYRVTLSADEEFEEIVSGFDNVLVSGGQTEGFTFSGIETNNTYFYRVEAEITSNVSSTISGEFEEESIRVSSVDPDESTVFADLTEVVADGDEGARIIVILKDEEEFNIPGIEVDLDANRAGTDINHIQEVTNSDGEAIFEVSSSIPGTITFTAEAKRPSGNTEISEKIEISFLPKAPVALSATEVNDTGFTANWELVEGVDTFFLDVATDENFETYVTGYQGVDVGLTTEFKVTGLEPGKVYYYRVRAEKDGLSSTNSQTIDDITFPKLPILNSPDNIGVTIVNVNWQEAAGAQDYLLDVARDQEFTDYVSDYESLNVGSQTSYEITGLAPGRTYYIRVRSKAYTRVSAPSTIIELTTAEIGITQTEINSSQLRVLANGVQENMITVFLRDTENESIAGEKINLDPNIENTQIRSEQSITGENGEAIFGVTSTTRGEVSYTAYVADTYEIGEISVEFLPVEGVLELGDNYPNPFNSHAIIPVTVPNRMRVKITISNVLGASVKTVKDQNLEEGYYEISVDLGNLASGTYFYRLMTGDHVETKKMLLVK